MEVRRRDFVTLIGGAAIAWPVKVRAQQQSEQLRRIGILHDYPKNDPEGLLQISAFREELAKLGWIEGRNIVIDLQAGDVEVELLRSYARDLLAKGPDIVVGAGGTIVAALQRASRTVPIVFVSVTDPVGGGLVASLARPGGNATGFTQFEFGISAKWLELLKENCAYNYPSSGHSRSHCPKRRRTARSGPGNGPLAWCRREADRCRRYRRD
jgi:putative tryptophan/tyrosine transport system substrate-binding protein